MEVGHGIFFALAMFSPTTAEPGRTAAEITDYVSRYGTDCSEPDAIRELTALERDGVVFRLGTDPEKWYWRGEATAHVEVREEARKEAQRLAGLAPLPSPGLWNECLRRWQVEALEEWYRRGCVGVIQAVTGTGKTRVGIEAARAHLAMSGKVLVIVPTRALASQWERELRSHLTHSVGRRGDGRNDDFTVADVVVSTVHSAVQGVDLRGHPGLLIADECHRYGAQTWGQALDRSYQRRLGLSATYLREDEGDGLVLAPFLGPDPIYDIGFRRAIDEDVVVPFRLAFVGVAMNDPDRAEYEKLSHLMRDCRRELIRSFNFPAETPGSFMRAVSEAAKGEMHPARKFARAYVRAMNVRRELLADNGEKMALLGRLAPVMRFDTGTLVFTQTKKAALEAASLLAGCGHEAAAIYGDLDSRTREHLLQAFKRREKTVLTAPRVLDEGIDVPEADLGIVLASSRGKRQMIQRMGRVLRKVDGKDHARLVVIFVEGTYEDPATGAHEGFIDLAWDVAENRAVFRGLDTHDDLLEFLGGRSSQEAMRN